MRFVRALLLALVTCSLLPRLALAENITYNLVNYPTEQNGWNLSGQITTDGATGALTASDIVSWNFTASTVGGATYSASSQSADAGIQIFGLLADASKLTLPLDPGGGNRVYFWDAPPLPADEVALGYDRRSETFYDLSVLPDVGSVWHSPNPAMGGTDPWVIGSVPTPSSLVGLCSLLGCSLVCFGIRRVWNKSSLRAHS
jgi:hypothetical protein